MSTLYSSNILVNSCGDAQDDKRVLSIPAAFSLILAWLLNEYVEVDDGVSALTRTSTLAMELYGMADEMMSSM